MGNEQLVGAEAVAVNNSLGRVARGWCESGGRPAQGLKKIKRPDFMLVAV